MAIKREDLISSVLNKVRQTFNDNQGWVRQGKFTPKQQVQTFTNKMTDDTGLFRGNKFGVPNFTPLKALGDYSYKGGPTVREAFNKLPEQAQQDWGQAGLVRNNPLLQKFAPKAIEPLATAVELGPAAYMNTWSKGLTTFSRDTTIPEKAWDLLGVYGSLNPAYATKNLASGPLGVGFNAITNKVSGKPALENWKQGWQQGQEFQFHANPINQATGTLVNQLATKIPVLQKFTETALKSNIQPTDKLSTAVGKWLSTSGRKVLKAAVLETAVETPIWASMTKTDQETYIEALEREAIQNLVMNVGMAGLNSLGDARQLAPIVKTSIDDAIQVYKNTPPQVTQGGYLNIFGNIVDGTSRTKLFDDAVYNLKENPNATPSDKGQATTNIINLAKRVLTNEEYRKIMSKKSGTYRGSTSAFDDLLDAVGKKIGSDIKTNKGYEEPFTINNLLSNKGKTREEILKSQSGKVNFFGDIDTKQSTEGFPQQNIKLKTNLGQSISPIKTGEVSTPQNELINEAKKYKSADEFVKDKVYSKFQATNVNEAKIAYENFLKSRKGMEIDNPEKLIDKYTFSNTNEKIETLRAIETYNNDNLKGYPEVDLINRIKSSYGEVIGNNVEQISKENKTIKLTDIWNKSNGVYNTGNENIRPNQSVNLDNTQIYNQTKSPQISKQLNENFSGNGQKTSGEVDEIPKTIKTRRVSSISKTPYYEDTPIIRKEKNITLYQGSKQGEQRQFWTPNKKYAEKFGDVKEKTGDFYLVDNGNMVTDVYIEVPKVKTGGETIKIKPNEDIVKQFDETIKVSDQPKIGVSKIRVKSNQQISPENLSKQVEPLSEMKPITIKQPAEVNLQSGKVLEPNKLDSSSESIIQQARQQIGKPIEPKKSFSQKYDEFYTNWVDRYNPVVKLTEGVKNIDPSKDPKYIIRRFLGAGGIAEQRFNTEMKPILKQIDDLGIDKTDLDTYLINKRNVGFGEIGRQVKGSDPVQSQKVVSALEAKYGDSIKGITDSIYEFQNKGLDEMVNAGFISPESANAMRGQNPNYAPFQRVMDEMNDYLGLPTKKAMVGTQPIQKLKGSERQILSPVESIISNIFSQRAAIEKNNVAKSVAGLQDIIPDLGFKKVSKGGDSTITVWNNGKKEFIEVGNDIARAMKGMNEESANSFMKILTAPASLLRQGATGRNPEFMLPNIIRDQLDAATNSKYGYVPFVDYIRGLYHVARKDITGADEVFDSWMKSGGSQSFGSISGRKSISEMFDKTKAKKGLFSWLGSGLDVAGKYSEVPTRLGLYGKAIKKGATPLEAAYESREGTMDFARMGAKMKVANSIIPFLNVQVQGFDKMIRNFKNAPAKTTLKMGLYGVAPAVMTTLYNEMYHPSEYAEIPQYVKDDNFVLVKGRNEKGTVDYITIPKGNLIRLATNPAQSFISYLAGNDKTTFGEMATQFLSSNLPLLGEGSNIKEVAIKTIGQNIPQAIKPITENLMNKSFYKYDTKKEQSKEIVPYYLQNKPPAEQTYKFTPAMYQTIGKIVNVSPLKVQNLMEGYLAGYTKIPANIIDSLKNISEGKDVEQNKVPILRRFIQETYPTSTTKTKPIVERTPLISQAQASEGGFLDKIFPNRVKTPEVINEIKYTNKNGNESTIKLGDVISMPEQTAYQKALKEKQKYTLVDDILDNLSGDQQIEALQTLGISSDDATYYNTAKQENYLKSIYVEEEIMNMIQQGQGKEQILDSLAGMRKAVNEKILLSDGVINDLVDKNIISYADGKALKNIDKNLKPKKLKAKKAKKISLSSKKFTASKKKYNPLKVKSTKTKSRFTPPKYVKADLRTPTKLL